jgi:hypothetical protein
MPAAIAIPLGLAAVSLVAGNVANKSANKNNLNQQAGAVQNAKQAEATAAQQASQLVASNPGPFAGQSIAGPTGGYAGPGTGVSAGTGTGAPPPAAPPAGSNTAAMSPTAQAILRGPAASSAPATAMAARAAAPAQGSGMQLPSQVSNPTQNPILRRILLSAGIPS